MACGRTFWISALLAVCAACAGAAGPAEVGGSRGLQAAAVVRQCMFGLDGCSLNYAALLSSAAPEPQSDLEKLTAKVAAAQYTCSQHTTSADCTAASGCVMKRATGMVMPMCVPDMNVTDIVLCPDSWAAKWQDCQYATHQNCSGTPKATECIKAGTTCMPKGFTEAFNMTEASMETSPMSAQHFLMTAGEKFYGCCPFNSSFPAMYSASMACANITVKKTCKATPACSWSVVDEPGNSGTQRVGRCFPMMNPLTNTLFPNGSFGEYAQSVAKNCSNNYGTMDACATSPAITGGVDDAKVKTFAAYTVAAGGGECTTTATPTSTTTTPNTTAPGAKAPGKAAGKASNRGPMLQAWMPLSLLGLLWAIAA